MFFLTSFKNFLAWLHFPFNHCPVSILFGIKILYSLSPILCSHFLLNQLQSGMHAPTPPLLKCSPYVINNLPLFKTTHHFWVRILLTLSAAFVVAVHRLLLNHLQDTTLSYFSAYSSSVSLIFSLISDLSVLQFPHHSPWSSCLSCLSSFTWWPLFSFVGLYAIYLQVTPKCISPAWTAPPHYRPVYATVCLPSSFSAVMRISNCTSLKLIS